MAASVSSHKIEIALDALATKISKGGALRVGFFAGAMYPSIEGKNPMPVATVAFWNEFGTKNVKARPFFRQTIAENSAKWGRGLATLMKDGRYDGPSALNLLGREMKNDLVTTIQRWPSDNKPSTVAKKKFNKGLVDTGVMSRNVGWKVTA